MAIDIIARGMIEESNGDVSQLSEKVYNHTDNSDIHVTSTDKSNWNGYATEIEQNKTDILNNKNDISQLFDITKGGETVTGESSYTLTDAADYPLLGLNLYGKSTQDGVPTPDTPVDIVSVGDSGTVNITSNNGGDITVTATITSALPLCGIPVDSGGNYTDSNGQQWVCDYVDFERGVKVQRVEAVKLTADNFLQFDVNKKRVSHSINQHIAEGNSVNYTMCNCLFPSFASWTYESGAKYFIFNTMIYMWTQNFGVETEKDWKTFIANNDIIVYHALATPIETPLSETELQAYRKLQTYNGMTNISNSAGAEMSVKYCTNNALSEFVYPVTMGLQKQIDELRAAVLSMGGNV